MGKMHQGIWLCNGILVISSATDLKIYSHYEELNCAKFLYSVSTEHFKFYSQLLLCTQGVLEKQINRKTLLLSFDIMGYFSIPEPYNQIEKKK